jgi:hypothetical protein
MPMLPSPLAAVTYAAIKVIGYAAFANGLNKVVGKSVSLLKFGISKTVIGLAAGVIYLFLVVPHTQIDQHSNSALLLGAVPIRMLAWVVAISIFYGFRARPMLVGCAILFGTALSYLLDGIMALLFHLPGMEMPFC